MPIDPNLVEHSPALVAVLPVLYVAWADGELSNDELAEIRSIYFADNSTLSDEEQAVLRTWLDPSTPPDVATLASWRRVISLYSDDIDLSARRSLSTFGTAIAARAAALRSGSAGNDSESGITLDGETESLKAIEDISDLLGLHGPEPVASFSTPNAADYPPEVTSASTDLALHLDGNQELLRKQVMDILSSERFADAPDGLTPYRDWVRDRIVDLADAGFGSVGYPQDHGGQDNMRSFITVFETLAFFDLSIVIKFGVQFGLFGGSIHQLGTKRHHTKLLPPIGKAELLGCFAMSELGHGSNVRDLRTTATYEHATREIVVNTPDDDARKEWIGNAARHGQLATVFAQLIVDGTNYGVHALLVPIRDGRGNPMQGVRLEDCGHKMGLNGIDNGRIWFDNVRIPVDSLLDRFASIGDDGNYTSPIASDGKRFFTMLGTLVGGRISVGCAGLSAAKTALTIAVRYSSSRRQFGPKGSNEVSLLTYKTQQRRLLPALAFTYGLHFALHDLADRYGSRSETEDHQEIEVLAAGLKSIATWHTTSVIQQCREACGGQGYLSINRFDTLKADTEVFTTFEGDNTVLMLQVAKGLLSSYRQQFNDMNWLTVARYVADRAADSIRERNPILARQTSSGHLRSAEFQHSAFEYREQSLLRSLAKRLKARIDEGVDSFDAVVQCQDHMVSLARAYSERVVIEQFLAAENRAQSETQAQLQTLRQLCGVHLLEQDRAWFLEQGYFEEGKSKAIRNEVNQLCEEVRPMAVQFVDAFGIPDSILRAPIAV